ncbi:FxDxF family PEP-CTERM protein [Ideonella sp. BN130291]|uniref:FxDxF family PEP-CTERM protein n=1 Tax=Ideonella sp. BN130291 TaxID=3112940 RepID=UPI002E2598FE|nr:FxDxF family PEP-CTERM protein [Ideonella sp. BN130291]
MKMRALAAVAAGALAAGPAVADVFNLGLLDMSKPLYHSFSNYVGNFADVYTFTIPGSSTTVNGDTTTVNFGTMWNVSLSSATLTGTGLGASQMDSNPNDGFSFYGLTGGGSYALTLTGTVDGTGLAGVTGIYAGYVTAVPEPQTVAMVAMGLLLTGVALRRRRS